MHDSNADSGRLRAAFFVWLFGEWFRRRRSGVGEQKVNATNAKGSKCSEGIWTAEGAERAERAGMGLGLEGRGMARGSETR